MLRHLAAVSYLAAVPAEGAVGAGAKRSRQRRNGTKQPLRRTSIICSPGAQHVVGALECCDEV